MIFYLELNRLPTPPAATAATSASAPASAHARCAAVTASASIRSAVSPGTASKGIPVPASTGEVSVSDTIASTASASPVAASSRSVTHAAPASPVAASSAGPIADAPASRAVAAYIAALPLNLAPGTSLTVSKRITARRTTKPVRGRPVPIRGTTAMLGVVLPVAAAGRQSRCTVPAADSTNATNPSGSSNPADATSSSNPTNAAGSSNPTNPSSSSDPANATSPSDPAAIPPAGYWI